MQQNTLGNIAYEITNYLGNVNVVISDRKTYVSTSAVFKAVVLSKTDYTACTRISWLNKEYGIMPTLISLNKEDIINRWHYFPFGMLNDTWFSGTESLSGVNPEWSFSGTSGEMDNEAKGEGNSYTTEFRQYDSRIGRWLPLDPLMAQFPWQSPYVAFNNNPIYYTDLQGAAAGGPGDPEKIPAGSSTNTTGCTTDDILSTRTTITTTATERTFNAKNQTFTTTTTVTNTVINTDKLTNKTTFSNSTYSYSETKSYEEVAGKKFNPFEIELEGYRNSDQYQKDDALMRWNIEQRLKVQASQYANPSPRMFEPVTREALDNSVMTLLPWYNIARGVQDIQEGNNWGWLKIGLEIIPLEFIPALAKTFGPRLAYTSRVFGYDSYLFGIGRNGFQKGVLNSGVIRMGWGFEATTRSHVLRIGIGNNPKFYAPTKMFGLDFHYHINLMKTPAKF